MRHRDPPSSSRDIREWVREQNIWRYRTRLTSALSEAESMLIRQLLAEEEEARAQDDDDDPAPAAAADHADIGPPPCVEGRSFDPPEPLPQPDWRARLASLWRSAIGLGPRD